MATNLSVQYDTQELRDLLIRFPDEVFGVFKNSVTDTLKSMDREVKSNFSASGGDKLRSRTGALRRSIRIKTTGNSIESLLGQITVGGIDKDIEYAVIHETGGTIRAKNKYLGVPGAPYLNAPLPSNLTPSGVLRNSARQIFNAGGYITRNQKGTYLVMSVDNIPMFYLRKESKIKARLGMRKAKNNHIPFLINAISSGIEEI